VHCVAGGAAATAHGGIGEPSCILPPRARRQGSAKAVIGRWDFTLMLSLTTPFCRSGSAETYRYRVMGQTLSDS